MKRLVLFLMALVLLSSTSCTVALLGRDLVGLRESDQPRNLNYSDPRRWDYNIPGARDWDAYSKRTNSSPVNIYNINPGKCTTHGPHYHNSTPYKSGYVNGKFWHERL
jgi:hypothetical protein